MRPCTLGLEISPALQVRIANRLKFKDRAIAEGGRSSRIAGGVAASTAASTLLQMISDPLGFE
jgi:hypothetical protein